jgi:hypothetical protein
MSLKVVKALRGLTYAIYLKANVTPTNKKEVVRKSMYEF